MGDETASNEPDGKRRLSLPHAGDQAGSMLAAAAIALFVVGASLLIGMQFIGSKVDLARTTQTNYSFAPVHAAIAAYVATNRGKLPCPDLNGQGLSAVNTCDLTPVWGLVPYRTLGLSLRDAVDQWGRRLTYAAGQSSACHTGGGVSDSLSAWTTAGIQLGHSVPYLLVSHGSNGRGAFAATSPDQVAPGQLAPSPANALESANCPRNVVNQACNSSPAPSSLLYVLGPYGQKGTLSGGNDAWFDDIVSSSTAGLQCPCVLPVLTGTPTTLDEPATINTTDAITVTVALTSAVNCSFTVKVVADGTSTAVVGTDYTVEGSLTFNLTPLAPTGTFKLHPVSPHSGPVTLSLTLNATIAETGQSAASPLALAFKYATPSGTGGGSGWTQNTQPPPGQGGNTFGVGGWFNSDVGGSAQSQYQAVGNNRNCTDDSGQRGLCFSSFAYFDFNDIATVVASHPSAFQMVTSKSVQNNNVQNSWTMNASMGVPTCIVSTPGFRPDTTPAAGYGPYIDTTKLVYADASWNWHSIYLNGAADHSIAFLGAWKSSTQTCDGFTGPITLNFPTGSAGVGLVLFFDPSYDSGPIVTPSAAGITMNSGTPGQIGAFVIPVRGAGYTSAPVVSFSGGGGAAEASAVMTGDHVASITVTSAGTGYTSDPAVVLTGGGGNGATAVAHRTGTGVSSVTVTSPGSGYTSAPYVSFASGGQAAGTAQLTNGVTAITVTNGGSGYTATPTANINTGSGGYGAQATAVLSGGTVGRVDMNVSGINYANPTTVSFSGSATRTATATATLSGTVLKIDVASGGSGFTSIPSVFLSGGGGTGAMAYANIDGIGTFYTCYAQSWNGATGANILFPPLYDVYNDGPYNWCDGQKDNVTNTLNPQFIYLYDSHRKNVNQLKVFPVQNSKFWIAAVLVELN